MHLRPLTKAQWTNTPLLLARKNAGGQLVWACIGTVDHSGWLGGQARKLTAAVPEQFPTHFAKI